MVVARDGVVKELPVAKTGPPVNAAYHLIEAPATVVANTVTGPGPQLKLSVLLTIAGALHEVVKLVTADHALVSFGPQMARTE